VFEARDADGRRLRLERICRKYRPSIWQPLDTAFAEFSWEHAFEPKALVARFGLGQALVFGQERRLVFLAVGVDFYAFHRTHHLALRFAVMAHAFRAAEGVDDVVVGPHGNGFVGALRFTDIAIDAFIGNTQRHDLIS
jgi:hypothetical protein